MRARACTSLLCVAVGGLLPGLAGAQQRSGALDAESATRVRGVITHQLTGETLAAVRVTIHLATDVTTRTDVAPGTDVATGSDGSAGRDGTSTMEPVGSVLWEGTTDDAGTFDAGRVPLGAYVIRAEALSFAHVIHPLDLTTPGRVDVSVEMVPEAIALEPIVVTAFSQSRIEESGFYDRRRTGFGYTLTRAEIEARNPARVSDLFVGIAGARLIRNPPEPAQIRLRGDCVPRVVLDGTPFAFPVRLDTLLQPYELEAIEVYHGSAGPVQFIGDSCGTVMLWSREPARVQGNPWSWKRLGLGLALLGLTILGTQ